MAKKFKPLIVLCGHEESQEICKAFRKLGHIAYSCDLKSCSGGHPEWHLKMDVRKAIKGGRLKLENGKYVTIDKWDIGIFCPDCTHITVSGNKWFKDQPKPKSGALVGKERREAQKKAVDHVKYLYNCKIPRVAIENPVGRLSTLWKKPTQIIQPWMYGHGEVKKTCLWLKNLPRLNATNIVEGREERVFRMGPSEERAALRAKTYPGIAKAMSLQWSYFK